LRLLAAKNHVTIFLYDGGTVPDPERIITCGHNNETRRTVAVHPGAQINARELTAMFKYIAADKRAGARGEAVVTADLKSHPWNY
jgi:hypothetical protein